MKPQFFRSQLQTCRLSAVSEFAFFSVPWNHLGPLVKKKKIQIFSPEVRTSGGRDWDLWVKQGPHVILMQ